MLLFECLSLFLRKEFDVLNGQAMLPLDVVGWINEDGLMLCDECHNDTLLASPIVADSEWDHVIWCNVCGVVLPVPVLPWCTSIGGYLSAGSSFCSQCGFCKVNRKFGLEI